MKVKIDANRLVNAVGKNTFIGTGLQNAIGASAPAQAGAMAFTVLHS